MNSNIYLLEKENTSFIPVLGKTGILFHPEIDTQTSCHCDMNNRQMFYCFFKYCVNTYAMTTLGAVI